MNLNDPKMNYEEEDKKNFEKYCQSDKYNKKYKYYPLILPARNDNQDIIVIGDLHGDFELTIRVLKIVNSKSPCKSPITIIS